MRFGNQVQEVFTALEVNHVVESVSAFVLNGYDVIPYQGRPARRSGGQFNAGAQEHHCR
jgi:hypothetical protein